MASSSSHISSKPSFPRALVTNYRAAGDYAFMNEHELYPGPSAKLISANDDYAECIRRGTCNGIGVSYLSKTWFNPEKCNRELYFYSQTDLLGSLQGDVVLDLLKTSIEDGDDPDCVQLAFALPHPEMWQSFFVGTPLKHKEQVISAYQKLHSRGILHGKPSVRNMILGYDLQVHIVDFSCAESLSGDEEHMIPRCTPQDLALEMRIVKFLLNYGDARDQEHASALRYHNFREANAIRSRIREETCSLPTEERSLKQKALMATHNLETLEDERFPAVFLKEPPFALVHLDSWISSVPSKTTVIRVPWATISSSSRSSEPLASPSKKRQRSPETDQQEPPSSKRVKQSVRFHPDTEDNRYWNTLRTYGDPYQRRPPSPLPRKPGQPIICPFGPDARITYDSIMTASKSLENPRKAAEILRLMIGEDKRAQESSVAGDIDPDSPRADMDEFEIPRCSPSPELRAKVAELEKDDSIVVDDSVVTSLSQSGDWPETQNKEVFDTPMGPKPMLPPPEDVEKVYDDIFTGKRQLKPPSPMPKPYRDGSRIASLMSRLIYWAAGSEEAQPIYAPPLDREDSSTSIESSSTTDSVVPSQESSKATTPGPSTYRRSLSPSPSPTILQRSLNKKNLRLRTSIPGASHNVITSPKEVKKLTSEQVDRIRQIMTRRLSRSEGDLMLQFIDVTSDHWYRQGYEKALLDAGRNSPKRPLSRRYSTQ